MVARTVLLFVVLLTTALDANGQQPRGAHRIGWLAPISEEYSRGLREALRTLGYVEGQTVELERRSAEDDLDRLPKLASELVRAKVDVIVAVSPPAILAAKQATDTIPIVMAYWGADGLIESGIVASFARPGGNVTGVYMLAAELDAKRLELLLQAVPKARRVGVLDPQAAGFSLTEVQRVAHSSSTARPPRRWGSRSLSRSCSAPIGSLSDRDHPRVHQNVLARAAWVPTLVI